MNTLLLLAVLLSQASGTVPLESGPVTAPLREFAKSAKLSGYIKGLKDLSGLPITLYNPGGPPLQTRSLSDGSFEFVGVPMGTYTLRAPGFTAVDLVVDGDMNVDLKPIYTGPGVTVSGNLKDRSPRPQTSTMQTVTLSPLLSGPNVTGGVGALGGTFGSSLSGSLEAWVRPDGKFEFPAVPPGSYILRTLPAAAGTSRRLEIAASDIRNLEIVIPYQLETTGRVLLEGRDLGPNATVQATQPTFTMATGIHADGSFKLRLTEGENQIGLTRLPVEFTVKKISFGSLDVTRHPLKVDLNTRPEEIVIMLETANLDTIPGVRVSGRLIAPAGSAGFEDNHHLRLSPAELGGKALEATPSPDGAFEFRKVPPGVYWLQGTATSSRTRIRVSNKEISDVEIAVPPRTQVAGQVVVVDEEGKPYPFRPNISMVFRLSNTGFSSTGVRADGTFAMPLIDNEYMTTVGNLPEGYAIRSLSSGAINLLENPLIVDAARVPDNIEVVLEYRPRTTR